jgi:hypothetical protein
MGFSAGGSEFPHHRDRLSAPSRPLGGSGQPSPPSWEAPGYSGCLHRRPGGGSCAAPLLCGCREGNFFSFLWRCRCPQQFLAVSVWHPIGQATTTCRHPSGNGLAGLFPLSFPCCFRRRLGGILSHPPHGVQHFITTVGQPSTAKFRRLDGCTVFSKLDLKKGYLQVPVAAATSQRRRLSPPFGLFEFVRMPFGLRNAGMTFQRLMDSLLGDLPFAFVYLDDILVASHNADVHRRHLCQVFSLLEQSSLIVNAENCIFGKSSIEFLGHQISAAGTSPLSSRVDAIASFPRPDTVCQLQAFLGLFNFYRKFIPAAARPVLPLNRPLRGSPRGDHLLDWSAEMTAAFAAARKSLSSTAVLEHPVPEAELSLVTDASSTHVGAVIQQRRPGHAWRPLGFFSAQLDKAQLNYSAFDRELFAVVAAIKHFRFMLEGRPFTVFTDHRPLLGALSRWSDPWSGRQQRHLSFIADFSPTVRHITGQSNVVADKLSRPAGGLLAASPSAQSKEGRSPPSGGTRAAAKGRTEVKVPSGS